MSRIGELLAQGAAEAYLLTSDANVRYVTGFTGGESCLLVTPSAAVLFTDSRYAQQAAHEIDVDSVELRITQTGKDRLDAVRDVLQPDKSAVVGLEEDSLSVSDFRKFQKVLPCAETKDVSGLLLELRSIKSPDEIDKIKMAAKATDSVMEIMLQRVHEGMSEYAIRAELIYAIAKHNMEPSFEPIVAAGPNGAMPHAAVSDYVVKKGDFITLDFGCRYEGYCADMTRTLAVGHVDGDLKTIYDVVEKAQKDAVNTSELGIAARLIDEAARIPIREAGYAENFGHGTGHGVGLQIHELPMINKSSNARIAEGMVFTIEPGIYVEGLGGVRIEDTCVAGEGSLFSFPKTLIELH